MTFKEIYDRIIPLWGNLINFSDGSAIDSSTNDSYFRSNALSRLWDDIEETVGHEDTFGDLMVWTMYQVFHKYAKRLFLQEVFMLDPKTIDQREIEEQYFMNLQAEGWEAELAGYERIV